MERKLPPALPVPSSIGRSSEAGGNRKTAKNGIMSLFGSIQLAANTLRANTIAMQVVGQNIANVNTPGYVREETVFSPAPLQRLGGLLLGLGVEVEAVVQKIDRYLEERLRGAVSERASSETQERTYVELEALIDELTDTDLSTSLNDFFASIAEILNEPEDVSVRYLAVLQGDALTTTINRLAQKVTEMRAELNQRIQGLAERINQLTEQIRDLNLRIAEAEGGSTSASDAVGLRDERLAALEELAEIISIQVREQPSGGVAVYSGAEFLVFEGVRREVAVVLESDRGLTVADVHLAETDAPLQLTGGRVQGLITARDDILGGFLDRLDDLAGTLAFEFNKIFSGGQGLNGFQQLTSEFAVDANDQPLDDAGLEFTPANGAFQILVHNRTTGLSETTDIFVELNHLGNDTTLDDLAAALDAVDGISAAATPEGTLTITSDSPDQEFFFANDTSGVLAALGLNTFFSGSTAGDLDVNRILKDDPAKFAARRIGAEPVPGHAPDWETANARLLAGFLDRPLESQNGTTLSALYDQIMGETAQSSALTRLTADAERGFEQTLRGEKMAISGVNLDEEAVKLIAYQHSFQASARYIAVLDELLDSLVRM